MSACVSTPPVTGLVTSTLGAVIVVMSVLLARIEWGGHGAS
jgi:hypothetical protein